MKSKNYELQYHGKAWLIVDCVQEDQAIVRWLKAENIKGFNREDVRILESSVYCFELK